MAPKHQSIAGQRWNAAMALEGLKKAFVDVYDTVNNADLDVRREVENLCRTEEGCPYDTTPTNDTDVISWCDDAAESLQTDKTDDFAVMAQQLHKDLRAQQRSGRTTPPSDTTRSFGQRAQAPWASRSGMPSSASMTVRPGDSPRKRESVSTKKTNPFFEAVFAAKDEAL